MPGKAAPKITLTQEEREELSQIVRKHLSSQSLVLRARIILMADEGVSYRETARALKTTRDAATKWRTRWLEKCHQPVRLRLQDEPRSGGPVTFAPEQVCQIVAIACEVAAASDRPISHWTAREVADEAMRRGIVSSISERQVGRFLKGSGSQTPSISQLAHNRTR